MYFMFMVYSKVTYFKRWNIPLIYALAQKKNQKPDIKAKRVVLDFEIAAIISIRKNFHETDVNGCFFHICQNMCENVQKKL